MPVLYIVNHAEALESCIRIASTSDSVLLIEDGVCAAERNNSRPLFALNDDLDDREMVKPGKNVEVVDYEGFVDLVTRHQPIISWR